MRTAARLSPARAAALFAATAAVYAIELVASRRLGARVPAEAVVFDLAVVVPFAWWALAVRKLPNAARRMLPIVVLSLAGAALIAPHEGRALVSALRLVVVPFEIAAAVVAVRAVTRALKSPRSELDLAERLEHAMAKALGDHAVARLLAAEASAIAYAIGAGRRRAVAPSGVELTTNDARSPAVTGGLVLVTVVESFAVHLMVGRAHPAVAWSLTAIGAYAVLWIVGQDRALAARVISVQADALVLRAGLRLTARVRWSMVEGVEELAPPARPTKSRELLDAARPVEANLVLRFRDRVDVTGPFGLRRRVRRVAVRVDDARGLAAAVRSLACSREIAREPSR